MNRIFQIAALILAAQIAHAVDYLVQLPPGCTVGGKTTLSGTCDSVTPPPITGSCKQGSTGDVPGYTAQCAGVYKLHSGNSGDKQIGPHQYTFDFVFGGPWPGSRFGTSDIFNVRKNNFIAVEFVTGAASTISINEGQTWTPHKITFSVSTAPGLFNDGLDANGVGCMTTQQNVGQCKPNPASGVVCVASNNPALKISSNGNTSAQCKLDMNRRYFFNAIPAYYSKNGEWITDFTTSVVQFATTLYSVN